MFKFLLKILQQFNDTHTSPDDKSHEIVGRSNDIHTSPKHASPSVSQSSGLLCETHHPQTSLSPSSLPTSIFESPPSSEISLIKSPEEGIEQGGLSSKISPYDQSSLDIGRHFNHAIILIMGVSGHGKSKMINNLVGTDILSVAKSSDGSITEVCIVTLMYLTTSSSLQGRAKGFIEIT